MQQNKNAINTQNGNIFLIILIGVILFGALGYTFSKSVNKGTGNLTKQQAKIAAQELISFFNLVDGAYNKLRLKGCSIDDISFSNNNDSWTFVGQNGSATAPSDFSCHIFNDNGGKITFNMDWTKYQIPYDDIPVINQNQYGQIYFKQASSSTVGIGTAANDIMVHLNFVQKNICYAYNELLGWSIDYSIDDPGPIIGDDNTDYVGKENFCRTDGNIRQIHKVWLPQ